MRPAHLDAPGLRGIWPALLSPLNDALSIDSAVFVAHARALLGAGCAGLTPFGTTGEGASFSVDERCAAVQALLDGGVPAERLLVSVSTAAVSDAVALVQHAQAIGAWGVLLAPPFFFKGVADEGVLAFYECVLQATAARPLRVVLYHIPQVVGVALSHRVIGELLQHWSERIVAIKDSGCERAPSLAMARAFMPPLGVHVGNEPDLPALAGAGSRGAISGLANFMPRTVQRLATEPDAALSAVEHARVQRLLAWLGGYALIPALKAIMAAQTGERRWLRVRPPLVALEGERFEVFARELAAQGLDAARD